MPIAMTLAAVALLATTGPVSLPEASSIIVDVAAAPELPASLVRGVLEETNAIWRPAGVSIVWERPASIANTVVAGQPSRAVVPALPSARLPLRTRLRVLIGDERHTVPNDPTVKALGWIRFAADAPEQEIYVSYANAVELFNESEPVVGRRSTMTVVEREALLARAMGRALAHEIGHYLLGSKVHTAKGLMQARLTAAQLFAHTWHGLRLAPEQKQLIAARLSSTPSGVVAGPGVDSQPPR
jgi:hypothetical protein